MDPSIGGETRPPVRTYEEFAKLIDHSLLSPELTEVQVTEGCEAARSSGVASVTVRPCDVDVAVRIMGASDVKVGSVAGFPHGSTTTAAKLYETRDLLRRGAKEIDMVINISKLLSRQFQHVETELLQMADTCHQQGALLKVIFENAYLTDELKMVACRICGRAGVDFVSTATGFAPAGYSLDDLRLIRTRAPENIQIKAGGGAQTVEAVLEAYQAGCSRFGATAAAAILEDWKARLQELALESGREITPPSRAHS